MRFNYRRVLEDLMMNGHRRVPDDDINATPGPSSAPHDSLSSSSAGKPALGFPLGTALVLFIVFGVATLFSCCYHWEKIRSHANRLSRPSSSPPSSQPASLQSVPLQSSPKLSKQALSMAVMMPGDEIPKYVAWPSPHGFLEESAAHHLLNSKL